MWSFSVEEEETEEEEAAEENCRRYLTANRQHWVVDR